MDTTEIKTTLHARLAEVQQTLNAPKSRYNSFGKYNYRSCEDILEAVKPLLAMQGLILTLTDTVENIGSRYYVKATATVQACDEGEPTFEEVSAYAREEEDKKGMDGSQITGTASSYARKYALNGLFLIDDTKDADTDEHHDQTASSPAKATPARQVDTTTGEVTETEADTPCEVPGCKNVVWGSKVAASRKFNKGHVICYTHSTNGDWEAALKDKTLPF